MLGVSKSVLCRKIYEFFVTLISFALTLFFTKVFFLYLSVINSENYFPVRSSGNSQQILTKNQFVVRTMFFKNIYISFVIVCSDLFSIIYKKFNQIRENVVFIVVSLVFVFCCAFTTGRCNAFQHFFVNQKNSEFYGPYFRTISCDYFYFLLFLVTIL